MKALQKSTHKLKSELRSTQQGRRSSAPEPVGVSSRLPIRMIKSLIRHLLIANFSQWQTTLFYRSKGLFSAKSMNAKQTHIF